VLFGGRLSTTGEYAVRAVLIQAGLAETLRGTQPPKAISWSETSSRVRNCQCVSILQRGHLKLTGTVLEATFWKARDTCVTCCWPKGIRFTINSSSAATTV